MDPAVGFDPSTATPYGNGPGTMGLGIKAAIRAQEGNDPQNPMQIMSPDVIKAFAARGEDPKHNPAHSIAVGNRYIDYLSGLPNVHGDPRRIAVGYFSGEGNIAPPGSAQPWKNDWSDGNIKTSKYVSDIEGRMGLPQGGGGGAPGAGLPTAAPPSKAAPGMPGGGALPDQSEVEQLVYETYGGDPKRYEGVLSKVRERYAQWNGMVHDRRETLRQNEGNLVEMLVRGVTAPIPEQEYRDVYAPAEAQHHLDLLYAAQNAGVAIKGAEWAGPDKMQEVLRDLDTGQGVVSDMIRVRHGQPSTGGAGGGNQPDDPETFKIRMMARDLAHAFAAKRDDALFGKNKDPAAWVMAEPTVNAAYQKYAQNPSVQTFDSYVAATHAIQGQLGVAEDDWSVLPRGAAQAMVKAITTPGADVHQMFDAEDPKSLPSKYGQNWDAVWRDVVRQGGLQPQWQLLGNINPIYAPLLSQVFRDPKGPANLAEMMDKTVKEGIDREISTDESLKALMNSYNASGMSESGQNGLMGGLKTLAYALARYQGDASAAKHAIHAFTDNYDFIGNARVPTKYYGQTVANTNALMDRVVAPPALDMATAPGMTAPGNLNPYNRPVLQNPDGSYSTTSSISIGTDKGEVLIPTVIDGKRVSEDEAKKHYQATGENFGTFRDVPSAEKFATDLHNAQAATYDEHGAPKQIIQPPNVRSGMTGFRTPQDYLDQAIANGHWATAPDESGLYWVGPDDERLKDRTGQPLFVPFKQPAASGYGPYQMRPEYLQSGGWAGPGPL